MAENNGVKLMVVFGRLGVVGDIWSSAERGHLIIVAADSRPAVSGLDCGVGHGWGGIGI